LVEVIEAVKKPFVPPALFEITIPIGTGLYVSEWALPYATKLTQPWAPAQYVKPFAKVGMGLIGMVGSHFAPDPYKKPLFVFSAVPWAMGLLESLKIALGVGSPKKGSPETPKPKPKPKAAAPPVPTVASY